MEVHPNFQHDKYLMHQKHFTIGEKYKIYDETGGNILFYVEREKFKLKSHIHVYDTEDKANELLTIYDKNIMGFNATFEVVDTPTGRTIGFLKRKGWSSLLRRNWVIRDDLNQEIGRVFEDSIIKALVRRSIGLLKTDFVIEVNGLGEVGRFVRKFSIRDKYILDLSRDTTKRLDRRMAIAAGILLDTAEKR
jgi:uncharacterized protein YxjI